MLTNKNKNYTNQFREITDKYGLDLNGKWNIRSVTNHIGRHSTHYHQFMLQKVKSFDVVAAGDTAKFLKYFNILSDYVATHTAILY